MLALKQVIQRIFGMDSPCSNSQIACQCIGCCDGFINAVLIVFLLEVYSEEMGLSKSGVEGNESVPKRGILRGHFATRLPSV